MNPHPQPPAWEVPLQGRPVGREACLPFLVSYLPACHTFSELSERTRVRFYLGKRPLVTTPFTAQPNA